MNKILAKKFPVTYEGKDYFVKIFKNEFQKYDDGCRTAIYRRYGIFYKKLNEEECAYSKELKDTDFLYFAIETIKRYLVRKQKEELNRLQFENDFDGDCSKYNFVEKNSSKE